MGRFGKQTQSKKKEREEKQNKLRRGTYAETIKTDKEDNDGEWRTKDKQKDGGIKKRKENTINRKRKRSRSKKQSRPSQHFRKETCKYCNLIFLNILKI